MAAKLIVLGPIPSPSPYLRSALGRRPFLTLCKIRKFLTICLFCLQQIKNYFVIKTGKIIYKISYIVEKA